MNKCSSSNINRSFFGINKIPLYIINIVPNSNLNISPRANYTSCFQPSFYSLLTVNKCLICVLVFYSPEDFFWNKSNMLIKPRSQFSVLSYERALQCTCLCLVCHHNMALWKQISLFIRACARRVKRGHTCLLQVTLVCLSSLSPPAVFPQK